MVPSKRTQIFRCVCQTIRSYSEASTIENIDSSRTVINSLIAPKKISENSQQIFLSSPSPMKQIARFLRALNYSAALLQQIEKMKILRTVQGRTKFYARLFVSPRKQGENLPIKI